MVGAWHRFVSLLMLLQNDVQLKNTYGAVWEGGLPSAPPLDLLISSSGQQLMLRYVFPAAYLSDVSRSSSVQAMRSSAVICTHELCSTVIA